MASDKITTTNEDLVARFDSYKSYTNINNNKSSNLGDNIDVISSANIPGSSVKSATATATNVTSSVSSSGSAIATKYMAGNSRLVDFSYIDGTTDNAHRAYLKIEDLSGTSYVSSDSVNNTVSTANRENTSASVKSTKVQSDTSATNTSTTPSYLIKTGLEGLRTSFTGTDASVLNTILAHLQTSYTSVIITSVQENLQERQHILPTVGDTFALTFTGKEPQILAISGYLPFDYSSDNSYSWYSSWVNAYKYIFRASILAKYNCRLRLIFPDFSDYAIYPVSLSCSISADNDMLIPFSMTSYVVNLPFVKASQAAVSTMTTTNPANILVSSLNSTIAKNMASIANTYSNTSASTVAATVLGANGFVSSIEDGVSKIFGVRSKGKNKNQNAANQLN